jgi:hypothetical protein
MVETITPVVHEGNRRRYLTSVALHTLGATLAAGAFGALLGALGELLSAPWGSGGAVAVLAVAGLYLLREVFSLPIPIPDRHRQVPEWWRRFYSPPTAAFLYGLGLGIGFLTFLTFGTFVAVAAGALVSGDPLLGAAVCAPFGLARGLSVLFGGWGEWGADPLDHIAATPWPRIVNALALGGVALAALFALN